MGEKKDRIIDSFAKVVRKSINPCRIILFGSRARGTAKEDSDYDFLLISPEFSRWEWEERSAKMYHPKRKIPAPMDIICLTPEEFKRQKDRIGIVQEITKKGIEI